MSVWALLGLGWALMAMMMAILWIVQIRTRDAGIVDVAWAAGVGGLSILFSLEATGSPYRRIVVASLASLWALRLAGHLLRRVSSLPEDGRYQKMRRQWGSRAQPYFFLFFQIQAVWSLLFALPMLIAANNPSPFLGWTDLGGILIWVLAVGGEMLADRQLASFRKDPAHQGKVCRTGLWYYSRHPNYFFEWLHWWSYVLIGWMGPWGPLTLIGPALMLFFLFKITGIPPTEANALASRGDAYRDYQRTTSVFFPWPPKRREVRT